MSQITRLNNAGPVPPGTGVLKLETDDHLKEFPDAFGTVFLTGGANIITFRDTAPQVNTAVISVTDSIYLPATLGPNDGIGLSKGVYGIENTRVLHTMGGLGHGNIFVGFNAGNLLPALTGQNNTIVGAYSGASLTSGFSNCTLGANNLLNNTSGGANVALGTGCLANNVSGNRNLSIGNNAGAANDANADDNINIGNSGSAGVTNRTTIGTVFGGGAGQDQCYIHGIYQAPVAATNENVVIDNTGKLGTSGPVCGSYGFLATIDADLPANLAPHMGYYLGKDPFALTQKYDNSLGAFFIGDAISEASFTAPITGLYSFTFNLVLYNVRVTNSTNCWMLLGTGIVGQPNAFASWSPYYMGAGDQPASGNPATKRAMYSFTQQHYLTLGQQVLFRFTPYSWSPTNETADLGLGQYTSISGYLVHT